jgi:hypothetical protein
MHPVCVIGPANSIAYLDGQIIGTEEIITHHDIMGCGKRVGREKQEATNGFLIIIPLRK